MRIAYIKGVSLIELVLSMVIVTISLSTVMIGLSLAVNHLLSPLQSLEAMNIIEYYQRKIESTPSTALCEKDGEFAWICPGQTSPLSHTIALGSHMPWMADKRLVVDVSPYPQAKEHVTLHFKLMADEAILFTSQMVKPLR